MQPLYPDNTLKLMYMDQENIYFISLTPPDKISREIELLKLEMQDKFGPRHALKSPPHITLQKPFRRVASYETIMSQQLKSFAEAQQPFLIRLRGFDRFSDRVIFVKVLENEKLVQLYCDLKFDLEHKLKFEKQELSNRFHPHITIATRDLTKVIFRQAWPAYEHRSFEAEFLANKLVLFKHNGIHWEVKEAFSLEK